MFAMPAGIARFLLSAETALVLSAAAALILTNAPYGDPSIHRHQTAASQQR
jgi:hypothetical protein